jgi:isoamylase
MSLCRLPCRRRPGGEVWLKELDTAEGWLPQAESLTAGAALRVEGRSMVVLRHAT